ncbi:MAG: 4a-hydroxytetrahydrobiopterin dehydratase [Vicinamibacterales bacterium]
MPTLSNDEIDRRLQSLPGWSRSDHAIVRRFTFDGFPEAVAFVARLVPGAEAADHHPDLTINYKRVTVSYSTHSEGGVTEKDFAGAAAADAAAHE